MVISYIPCTDLILSPYVVNSSVQKKKCMEHLVICVTYHIFLQFSILRNTTSATGHSGQKYGVQHGNGVLLRAGTLPVSAYVRYIPHSIIDGNNTKAPF